MSLIHPTSCPCTKAELDLFTSPPTQVAIDSGHWVEHHPVSSLTDTAPVEFLVSGTPEYYIDLSNTFLYVKARVVKLDGRDLDGEDVAAPCNLFLHSLFSQLDVHLSNVLVSSSNNTYSYRAFLETFLSSGTDQRSGRLTAALWYHDTPGKHNVLEIDPKKDHNMGFLARRRYAALSSSIEMVDRLHGDIFAQDRYLLNSVDMKIKLSRTKDSFSIMSEQPQYKVNMLAAVLHVRKVKLAPSIISAHEAALLSSTVKYPIRRCSVKTLSIAQGITSHTVDNLFLGQLPVRLVLGFVDNRAVNGECSLNPFAFDHHHLSFLAIYHDGNMVPHRALTPRFATGEGLHTLSFMSLFTGLGLLDDSQGIPLSISDYSKGYCLYAFDLTPDLAPVGGHFNLMKQGNIRMEVHFDQPLDETVSVVVYAEFENMIEIDKSRSVFVDYAN